MSEKQKKAMLNVVTMKVSDLLKRKAEYNPRKISEEKKNGLKYSIETFGYVQNIIYNKRTKRIIAGHQRLDILNEKGYETFDVHVVDLDEETEKKLNIVMNSPTVSGDFTFDLHGILDTILDEDPELYDMTNMARLLSFDDEEDEKTEKEVTKSEEEVEGMKLFPYESYDCILVVCKRRDDFMFLSSLMNLNEKRIISSPNVVNKKTGFTRCVDGKDLIKAIKEESEILDIDTIPGLVSDE